MKPYHKTEAELNIGSEAPLAAEPEANERVTGSELLSQPEAGPAKKGVTRRRFMRDAALGAAAAGAVLSMKGGAGSAGDAFGQTTDSGTVTLDAILLSYVSSPQGTVTPSPSIAPSQLTLTSTYANTMTVSATASQSTTISGGVSVPGLSITGGYTQSNSTQVTNGVTISSTSAIALPTLPPAGPAETVFFGLLAPQLQLSGNPASMQFKFLKTGTFNYNQAGVLNPALGISPNTANQILAQYPLLTEPNGSTLTKPRFKVKPPMSANTPIIKTIVSATGTAYSEQLTSTITSTITASVGFSIAFFKLTFAVSNTMGVTMTSVQETTSNKILAYQFYLYDPSLPAGVWTLVRDKIWKTYLIVNNGAGATSGQPVITGTVTDSNGSPIAGAFVDLASGGVVACESVTNSSGSFIIATTAGNPIPPGAYTITSGNITNNVTVGSGATVANIAGVIAEDATDPTEIDETVYTLDD
ncbi:MAG TPA: carboxypeptidase-like regulatory domain-containing protein [Blastocatellia bacterium]